MKTLAIKVRSITYALKGKNILAQHGISANIQRSRHGQQEDGCGYWLLLKNPPEDAVDLLTASHVSVLETEWQA